MYEKFLSPKDLSDWVFNNGISKENIQNVVFDSVFKKFILFYWE